MKQYDHPGILGLFLSSLLTFCFASTPNVIVSVGGESWMAKRGLFGSKEDISGDLIHSPDSDPLMCNYDPEQDPTPVSGRKIMLIPRGTCTFKKKAYAARQQFGVAGVLIYDTLSSKYMWNETTQRVDFPQAQTHYECENGFGTLDFGSVILDPPEYNATVMDPLLIGCNLQKTRNQCDSGICLITSHKENSTEYPVCCAWDLPVTMDLDDNVGDVDDTVAVFLTMSQANDILPQIGSIANISARPRTSYNFSFILLWVMATGITCFGAWYAAKEYSEFGEKLEEFKQKQGTSDVERDGYSGMNDRLGTKVDDAEDETTKNTSFKDEQAKSDNEKFGKLFGWRKRQGANGDENDSSSKPQTRKTERKKRIPDLKSGEQEDGSFVLYSLPPPERKKKGKKGKKTRPNDPDDNAIDQATREVTDQDENPSSRSFIPSGSSAKPSIELNSWHIFGFVASASIMVVLLFVWRFYNFIFVLYALGCSGAVSYLIFGPLLTKLVPKIGGDVVIKELNKEVCCRQNGFDITSQLAGLIWASVWIWYGLSHYQPLLNWFFWITQDIFGAAVCIMFLGAIKLNSIKIATYFLVAVFFYDIFFVFVTPLFTKNGQSVMLSVAEGGGDTPVDDFCFKYPKEGQCTGIISLPMVLTIPRISDWSGGSALLGLGDILLPGFLVAYAARVDAAARLLGAHTSIDIDVPQKWYQGYFFPISLSYALGLLITFIVLWVTGSGQPALLYLTPTCLAGIFIVGRKEIKELWIDNKVLRLADKLKNKCEKKWSRQRLQRQVERKKRERARIGHQGPYGSKPSRQQMERPPRAGSGRPSDVSGSEFQRVQGRERGRGGQGMEVGKDKSSSKQGRGKSTSSRVNAEASAARAPPKSKAKQIQKESEGQPEQGDVCFGKGNHPGTQQFARAVLNTMKVYPDEEFGPEIYKHVKKQLKGKKFFINYGSSSWTEVSRVVIKSEMEKTFNALKRAGN